MDLLTREAQGAVGSQCILEAHPTYTTLTLTLEEQLAMSSYLAKLAWTSILTRLRTDSTRHMPRRLPDSPVYRVLSCFVFSRSPSLSQSHFVES